MCDSIKTPNQQDRLAELTSKAKSEHLAVGLALGNALQHAMNCGDALLAIREMVPDGKWQVYLRDHDIPARSARVYLQVAKSRALLERQSSAAGPISIAQALEYLRDPEGKRPATSRRTKTEAPKLDVLGWILGSPKERTIFLDGIGLPSLLAALPPTWRAEIDRRVRGQRAASTSIPADKATAGLRVALSQAAQKTDQDRVSAVASLNAINNLLAAQGLSFHDVEIRIAVGSKLRTGGAPLANPARAFGSSRSR
jgi:hypothetical protein